MKKSLLYTALGLMGIMGALAIGVVNAATITHYTGSNISYTLNEDELFTGVGTITITDLTDTITILDRNLGAKKAGTGCDYKTNGEYCPYDDTYGYHFQWGNNHGFKPGCDLSGSTDHCSDTITSSAVNGQVDATTISYYPANQVYYESGVFYKGYYNWLKDNSKVNLRGGSTGGTDTITSTSLNGDNWKVDESTVKNRQGPCPEGFHVPSLGELYKLRSMLKSDSKRNTGVLHNELLIPFAGFRDYKAASVSGMSYHAYLWSSSPNLDDLRFSRGLHLNVDDHLDMGKYRRANALSVRCFYDSYQPFTQSFTLSFISDGEEVGTGGVTENMTGAVPDKVTDKIEGMTNTTKTGYVLDYRYLSGADPIAEFDFTGTAITGGMADDSGNVYFIAQWTGIKYSVEFTGTDIEGTMENQMFTYGIAQNLTANAFTKNGYTFSGWTDGTNIYTNRQSVKNLTTTSGKIITLTAQRTKDKQTGGYSGGGGMKKDNCPDGDLSPSYYDGMCEENNSGEGSGSVSSGTDVKDLEGDTQDSSDKSSEGQTELEQAYQFAFKNSITTMDTIDKANMDGYIKRGHLAKMVVNYVTNVLGREITSDIPASCLSFNDETTVRESEEIKDYAIKSCALGLMGIRMKNNEFLPNDYVTRAEFGAVLSRILRGDKYNLVHTQEKPRYTDHLNALKEEGIMTKIDNPQMQEKRGYVMIMLMRSVK